MIYLTSDQHFYHKNVIKYAKRPFPFSDEGLELCNRSIVDNYNNIVTDNDLVFHLGDVLLYSKENRERAIALIRSLKGTKILIKGNHDDKGDKFYKECGFRAIFDYLSLGKVFLAHYDLSLRDHASKKEIEQLKVFQDNKCELLIHGHIHNKDVYTDDGIQRVNVCVDYYKNDFKPLCFPNLDSYLMSEIKILNIDLLEKSKI